MFCPRCGCALEEKVAICRECGYRIPRKDLPDLSEDQYLKDVHSRMAPGVKKSMALRAAAAAMSLILIFSFMMEWGGYTSLDGTVHSLTSADFLGTAWLDRMGLLGYVPALVPVLGIVMLIASAAGFRGWLGVIGTITGFSAVLIIFAFSIQLGSAYITTGYAVYLDMVLCIAVSFAGSRCMRAGNGLL